MRCTGDRISSERQHGFLGKRYAYAVNPWMIFVRSHRLWVGEYLSPHSMTTSPTVEGEPCRRKHTRLNLEASSL